MPLDPRPQPFRRSVPTPRLAPAARLALVVALTILLLVPSGTALAGKKKRAKRPLEPAAGQPGIDLAKVRELIDAERPDEALAILDPWVQRQPKDAEALLLRSTARIMTGDLEAGRADLERSLKLDPKQRQGWLNLGAMEIADKHWDPALQAFEKAEALDPAAPDNDLNIGAVLLLEGKLEPASQRFSAYLSGSSGGTAEAYYLVATNYALAGYAALAVEHLKRAIQLDERIRVNARSDPNFASLRGRPELDALLSTDTWRPAPGAYTAAHTFDAPYEAGDGELLKAVLDTLQLAALPFDPRVEVTPDWALIWGDMRIKVTRGEKGKGRVEVSADPGRFTPAEWKNRLDLLFDGIDQRLLMLRLKGA